MVLLFEQWINEITTEVSKDLNIVSDTYGTLQLKVEVIPKESNEFIDSYLIITSNNQEIKPGYKISISKKKNEAGKLDILIVNPMNTDNIIMMTGTIS